MPSGHEMYQAYCTAVRTHMGLLLCRINLTFTLY